MVIAARGAALAACVLLASAALSGVRCAKLTFEGGNEQRSFRLFYSVRKLTWKLAQDLCNISSAHPSSSTGDDTRTIIDSEKLSELIRRQKPEFQHAWVVSNAGGECLQVTDRCNERLRTRIGSPGCQTKVLVVVSEPLGCVTRTNSAVICHREYYKAPVSSAAVAVTVALPIGSGTAGLHNAATLPPSVKITKIAPTTAKPPSTNGYHRSPSGAAMGRGKLLSTAASDASGTGHRMLWAASMFMTGLQKGEKALLALICGVIGAFFLIGSVCVVLFCIHPQLSHNSKRSTRRPEDPDEALPLLVTHRHADTSGSSGGSTVCVESVMRTTAASHDALADDRQIEDADAEHAQRPLPAQQQRPAHDHDEASPVSRQPPDPGLNRAEQPAPTAAVVAVTSDGGGSRVLDGEPETSPASQAAVCDQQAAPAGQPVRPCIDLTHQHQQRKQWQQRLSAVPDLTDDDEVENHGTALAIVARQPLAVVSGGGIAVATTAAVAARPRQQDCSRSSTSGRSQFVLARETNSGDSSSSSSSGGGSSSSSRSRSPSTTSADTWWPPLDCGPSFYAGDSHVTGSGQLVTAL